MGIRPTKASDQARRDAYYMLRSAMTAVQNSGADRESVIVALASCRKAEDRLLDYMDENEWDDYVEDDQ